MSRIPPPPKPTRSGSICVRLSADEVEDLERTRVMLGTHWGQRARQSDVIRTALAMLKSELERSAKDGR